MKENRTDNVIKNSLSGIINKLINIFMPFVTRTIIIYFLGIQYAGLNSLFSSILQVLNLAELGISSAIVYCMYKPMAENNIKLICELLKYIKKVYYIIGTIILGIGLFIIPFLRYLITGTVPVGINVTTLYIIYLLNTVIGYYFFAYRATLLNAGQKVGVLSKINSQIVLIQSIIQIIVIIILKNYYLYLLLMPFFTLINNIMILFISNRYYPNIKCIGVLNNDEKRKVTIKVKGLLITRICTTTRNAFDSIFISAFIGLTAVAIYGNYYYILSAVTGLLSVFTTAITASVGNSMVTEKIEKNYGDFKKMNFLFNWLVGFCTCCLLTMFQPFMRLWMGEESLFSFSMVIILCAYFYFLNCGSIRAVYHDAAGLWWEARYRAIIEAVLNLFLNFVLTKKFGVIGTVLGTLISLIVVNYAYGAQIVFKYYFREFSCKKYFIDNFIYLIVTIIGCSLTQLICMNMNFNGAIGIIIPLGLSFFVFNLIYFIAFYRTKIFRESKTFLFNIIKRVKP